MATELREMLTVSEIMENGELETYYQLIDEGLTTEQAMLKVGQNIGEVLLPSDWEEMMEERRGNNE